MDDVLEGNKHLSVHAQEMIRVNCRTIENCATIIAHGTPQQVEEVIQILRESSATLRTLLEE